MKCKGRCIFGGCEGGINTTRRAGKYLDGQRARCLHLEYLLLSPSSRLSLGCFSCQDALWKVYADAVFRTADRIVGKKLFGKNGKLATLAHR